MPRGKPEDIPHCARHTRGGLQMYESGKSKQHRQQAFVFSKLHRFAAVKDR